MSVDADGKPDVNEPSAAAPVRQQGMAGLFDQWGGPLLDYCGAVLAGHDAAASAAQDTLIAAQQRIGELADRDRELSWVYALARVRCADGWSGTGLDGSGGEQTDDNPEQPGADTAVLGLPDLEAEAIRQEQLQIITAAMASLSPEDRVVLDLAFRHGLGELDLAPVLGLPPRRVRALLSGASNRFSQVATAVAALRSGLAVCQKLESIAGDGDPGSPVFPGRVRKQLARHIRSCPECTQSLRGRVLGPDLLGAQPLAPAPRTFRVQVLAAGADPGREAYRREVAARFGKFGPGGFPAVQASKAMRRAARRRRG